MRWINIENTIRGSPDRNVLICKRIRATVRHRPESWGIVGATFTVALAILSRPLSIFVKKK
jgi:hypothetical protein